MTTKTTWLVAAVQQYFTELRMIRASGGGTDERSNYVPLTNLLNAVGKTLKPKIIGVPELADQGAGHPDLGLYAAHQVRRGKPQPSQPYPDTLLRYLLGLGALVAAEACPQRAVRLARGGLAPESSRAPGSVQQISDPGRPLLCTTCNSLKGAKSHEEPLVLLTDQRWTKQSKAT